MAFKEKMAAAQGGAANGKIVASLQSRGLHDQVPCADAESIVWELAFEMREIGRTLDVLGIRISRCQLGLFGYDERGKIVQAAESVTPELQQALRAALVAERLPCSAAWEIARRLGVSRSAVASAGEALGIKIKPCQLGAF